MDQYEHVKNLGRGAFGVATLVRQRTAGRRDLLRVVKQVDLELLSPAVRNEVHKEVGILRQLSHQHIVAYIDTFSTDTQLHIVMEYADGGDLAGEVRRRQQEAEPLSDNEALVIFGQCILALRYVHSKNILHRDLKCQNIFRMKTGDIKLGDFGIAKVLEHTAASAGTVIGTPAYLAPEVCENQPYNTKVDIWAMGVVLYELLALQQPFTGGNMCALVMKIVMTDPPALPDHVGSDTKEVVRRTLQKQPEERPSAAEILLMPVVHCAVGGGEVFGAAVGMDQFEEIKKLGQGAFGVAVLVKQRSLGGHAPLRVVKKVELTAVPESVKRGALEEVRVLRRLSHPHVIAYFDYFEEQQVLHIVLEYADGGDLATSVRNHIDKQEEYPEEEVMVVFGQCLKALEYIHSKLIVHRDLKCQNVFLMKCGDVKLGDFGISKVMEHTASIAGTTIGTPSYLAPEICENAPYGTKVDMWSLGIILYELMALKQPFQAGSIVGMIMKIVKSEPAPLPPRYTEDLQGIVKRLLKKQADERPTATELLTLPMVIRAVGSSDTIASPKSTRDAARRADSMEEKTEIPMQSQLSTSSFASGPLGSTSFSGVDGTCFTMTPVEDSLSGTENALRGALQSNPQVPQIEETLLGTAANKANTNKHVAPGLASAEKFFDPEETDDWSLAELPEECRTMNPKGDDVTMDPGAAAAPEDLPTVVPNHRVVKSKNENLAFAEEQRRWKEEQEQRVLAELQQRKADEARRAAEEHRHSGPTPNRSRPGSRANSRTGTRRASGGGHGGLRESHADPFYVTDHHDNRHGAARASEGFGAAAASGDMSSPAGWGRRHAQPQDSDETPHSRRRSPAPAGHNELSAGRPEPSGGGCHMSHRERLQESKRLEAEKRAKELEVFRVRQHNEAVQYRHARRQQEYGHSHLLDHGDSYEAHFGVTRPGFGTRGEEHGFPPNSPGESRPVTGNNDHGHTRGRRPRSGTRS